MKWRDVNGKRLNIGDVVEDFDRRVIGLVTEANGLPCIQMQKQFRTDCLGYVPLDNCGPKEAYIRGLVDRHTKFWWWLHRYTLNVLILKKAEQQFRARKAGTVQFETPIPW